MFSEDQQKSPTAAYSAPQFFYQLFEQNVSDAQSNDPNRLAVKLENQTISYFELNKTANHYAHYLLNNNETCEHRIIFLYMGRSIDLIAWMLAVHKAGKAFVMVDPEVEGFKEEQLANKLADCKKENGGIEPFVVGKQLGSTIFSESAACPENPSIKINLSDLAYIAFTSGSTGTPKGVMTRHEGLLHSYQQHQKIINYGQNWVFAQFCRSDVDAFIMEVMQALGSKGCLCIIPIDKRENARALAKYFSTHKINVAIMVPSTLQLLAKSLSKVEENYIDTYFSKMKVLISTGEKSIETIANQWLAAGMKVFNGYGPNEFTIASTLHPLYQLNESQDSIYRYTTIETTNDGINALPVTGSCIGQPFEGRAFYLFKYIANNAEQSYQQINTPDSLGELYIAGIGCGAGYCYRESQDGTTTDKRKQLSEQRFVTTTMIFPETQSFYRQGVSYENQYYQSVYRTGDKCFFKQIGDKTYWYMVGRYDKQLKRSGNLFSPELLETLLTEHRTQRVYGNNEQPNSFNNEIAKISVFAQTINSKQCVIAALIPNPNLSINYKSQLIYSLASEIKQSCPTYMLPTHWLVQFEHETPHEQNIKNTDGWKLHIKVSDADLHLLVKAKMPASYLPSYPAVIMESELFVPLSKLSDLQQGFCTLFEELLDDDVTPHEGTLKVSVDPQDDFYLMGGDSLLASQLRAKAYSVLQKLDIQEYRKYRFPLESFKAAPTPASLALDAYIQCYQLPTLQQPTLTGKAGDEKPLLYFIHPLLGDGEVFNNHGFATKLAKQLGCNPCCISHPGLTDKQLVFESIELCAYYYLQQIKQAQANGPYVICGLSAGGVIGHEIVRQLEAQGEHALLYIIDSSCPAYIREALPYEDHLAYCIKLAELSYKEILNKEVGLTPEQKQELKARATKVLVTKEEQIRVVFRFFEKNFFNNINSQQAINKLLIAEKTALALLNYQQSTKLSKNEILCKANDTDVPGKEIENLGWQVPSEQILSIPGTHLGIITDENIATQVSSELAKRNPHDLASLTTKPLLNAIYNRLQKNISKKIQTRKDHLVNLTLAPSEQVDYLPFDQRVGLGLEHELDTQLGNKSLLLYGHSGMGKTTLVEKCIARLLNSNKPSTLDGIIFLEAKKINSVSPTPNCLSQGIKQYLELEKAYQLTDYSEAMINDLLVHQNILLVIDDVHLLVDEWINCLDESTENIKLLLVSQHQPIYKKFPNKIRYNIEHNGINLTAEQAEYLQNKFCFIKAHDSILNNPLCIKTLIKKTKNNNLCTPAVIYASMITAILQHNSQASFPEAFYDETIKEVIAKLRICADNIATHGSTKITELITSNNPKIREHLLHTGLLSFDSDIQDSEATVSFTYPWLQDFFVAANLCQHPTEEPHNKETQLALALQLLLAPNGYTQFVSGGIEPDIQPMLCQLLLGKVLAEIGTHNDGLLHTISNALEHSRLITLKDHLEVGSIAQTALTNTLNYIIKDKRSPSYAAAIKPVFTEPVRIVIHNILKAYQNGKRLDKLPNIKFVTVQLLPEAQHRLLKKNPTFSEQALAKDPKSLRTDSISTFRRIKGIFPLKHPEKIAVPLQNKQEETSYYTALQQTSAAVKLSQLFTDPNANNQHSLKRIAIEGVPGTGKTTLLRQIEQLINEAALPKKDNKTLDSLFGNWPNQFKAAVFIPLESIAKYKYTLSNEILSDKDLLVDFLQQQHRAFNYTANYKECRQEINALIKHLQNLSDYTNQAVLFLLDDYDSLVRCWSSMNDAVLIKKQKLILKELLDELPHWIITARDSVLTERQKKSADRVLNLTGFNEREIEKFIKENYHDNSIELMNQINTQATVKEITRVPLLLDMYCNTYCYYSNQGKNNNSHSITNNTLTRLYTKFVTTLLTKFILIESDNRPNIIILEEKLEKLAFEMIFSNKAGLNRKDMEIKFSEEDLQLLKNSQLFRVEQFITVEGNQCESWCFIHSSFQEYYAAKAIIDCLNNKLKLLSNKNNVLAWLKQHRYAESYRSLLCFCAGILAENISENQNIIAYDDFFEAINRDANEQDTLGNMHLKLLLQLQVHMGNAAKIPNLEILDQHLCALYLRDSKLLIELKACPPDVFAQQFPQLRRWLLEQVKRFPLHNAKSLLLNIHETLGPALAQDDYLAIIKEKIREFLNNYKNIFIENPAFIAMVTWSLHTNTSIVDEALLKSLQEMIIKSVYISKINYTLHWLPSIVVYFSEGAINEVLVVLLNSISHYNVNARYQLYASLTNWPNTSVTKVSEKYYKKLLRLMATESTEVAKALYTLLSTWITYLIQDNQSHTQELFDLIFQLFSSACPSLNHRSFCLKLLNQLLPYLFENEQQEFYQRIQQTLPLNFLTPVDSLEANSISLLASYFLFKQQLSISRFEFAQEREIMQLHAKKPLSTYQQQALIGLLTSWNTLSIYRALLICNHYQGTLLANLEIDKNTLLNYLIALLEHNDKVIIEQALEVYQHIMAQTWRFTLEEHTIAISHAILVLWSTGEANTCQLACQWLIKQQQEGNLNFSIDLQHRCLDLLRYHPETRVVLFDLLKHISKSRPLVLQLTEEQVTETVNWLLSSLDKLDKHYMLLAYLPAEASQNFLTNVLEGKQYNEKQLSQLLTLLRELPSPIITEKLFDYVYQQLSHVNLNVKSIAYALLNHWWGIHPLSSTLWQTSLKIIQPTPSTTLPAHELNQTEPTLLIDQQRQYHFILSFYYSRWANSADYLGWDYIKQLSTDEHYPTLRESGLLSYLAASILFHQSQLRLVTNNFQNAWQWYHHDGQVVTWSFLSWQQIEQANASLKHLLNFIHPELQGLQQLSLPIKAINYSKEISKISGANQTMSPSFTVPPPDFCELWLLHKIRSMTLKDNQASTLLKEQLDSKPNIWKKQLGQFTTYNMIYQSDTLISRAILDLATDCVNCILTSNSFDVNWVYSSSETVLNWAVRYNSEIFEKPIIFPEIFFNQQPKKISTLIKEAIRYGNLTIIQWYFKYQQTNLLGDLLLMAIRYQPQLCQQLLSIRAECTDEINERDELGMSVYTSAAAEGHLELLQQLLVDRPPNFVHTHQDKKGDTCLLSAVWQNQSETVTWLLENGAAPATENNEGGFSAYILAAAVGHHKILEQLLTKKPSEKKLSEFVHTHRAKSGHTCLLSAIENNKSETVAWLLENGAQPEQEYNHDGFSAYTLAAGHGYLELLQQLLRMQDLHFVHTHRGGNGYTCLLSATMNNQSETVAWLLEHGAQPEQEYNHDGFSAYTLAAAAGHIELLQQLPKIQDREFVHTHQDGNKSTCLLSAITNNQPRIVSWLLIHGAMPEEEYSRRGFSAYTLAAAMGHIELLKQLPKMQDREFVHTHQDGNKFTCLLSAITNNQPEIVAWLLENGAQPEQEYAHVGFSAYTLAAAMGHLSVLRELLDIQPTNFVHTHQDKNRNTCLTSAIRNDQSETAAWLLQKGYENNIPPESIYPIDSSLSQSSEMSELHECYLMQRNDFDFFRHQSDNSTLSTNLTESANTSNFSHG